MEILNMVSDFNKGTLDLRRLNYGVITLVPKVEEANTIKQYRPICLLNMDFKIFPKLLIDRITPIAGKIISNSHTAFIKGRNILERVIILHEVIHELRWSSRQEVMFKIDFEKPYDKVRWDFVKEVLVEKSFPTTWITQTMSTIQGGRVCININGERSKFFNTYQGLRQGTPLSPIMFNLVVEVIATLMRKDTNHGMIKGVMTHLLPEGITHIQYADDIILMVEGNEQSITYMKFILYCFELLSGLRINYKKSEAYVFGMEEEEKVKITNMLNCRLGEMTLKYLGIPISDTKLGMDAFAGISEHVAKKVPP
jgi:hypothetical protein